MAVIVVFPGSGRYGLSDEIGPPPAGGGQGRTSAVRRMASGPGGGYGALMRERLRRLPADPRFQRGTDAFLAGVILAASLVEIEAGSAEWSASVAVEVVVALVCAVPLVWRRSHPIVVAVVVAAGVLAAGAVVAPVQGPFEVFVAYVVALYSVGVHSEKQPGLRVLAAVSVSGALCWLAVSRLGDGADYGDWFPGIVWGVFAWGVGRVIRRYNERMLTLHRLTVELEAERDARAREAVTVERARIARELHDVVAHNISVMGVQAAAASRIMTGDEPEVRAALLAIETTGRETVDEMRRMLGILRRSEDELALTPQPSLRDLDALVAQVRAAGLDVEARVEGEPRPLPAGLDLSAYRIVQEALTNALKHAAPARVEVVVRYADDAVVIEVSDDGAGGSGARGTGNGLVGMRERVALFGGEFRAGKRVEGGWALHATLPVGAT
jgi:signal transduction histidine kinase